MDNIPRNTALIIVWTLIVTSVKALSYSDITKHQEVPSDGRHINITRTPWIIAIVGLEVFVTRKGSRLDFDHAFCSGGLIHEHYVLTAAHCYRDPKAVSLIAGLDIISEGIHSNQELGVRRWHNHPCYDSYFHPEFDIAIVRPNGTFKLGPTVGLIRLDGDVWPQHQMYTRKCIAVEWEEIYFKNSSQDELHYVNVTARHGERACPCAMSHQEKRFICDDPKDVKRGCLGTSGGLMVCDNKAVGVASSSRTLRCLSWDGEQIRCDIPNSVVAWIYICPLLDWIKVVTNSTDVPSKPASCLAVNFSQPYVLVFIASCLLTIMKCFM